MSLVLAVGGPGYRLPVTVLSRRDEKSLQPQTQNPAVALELTLDIIMTGFKMGGWL